MGCVQPSSHQFSREKYTGLDTFQSVGSSKFISDKNVVAVNDQKKKHNLTDSQILELYQKSRGSMERFFSLLSERVTQFYDDLSSEILQSLNNHKLTYNETKIMLSQQVLVMALDVLEVLGRRIDFSYSIQTFHHFNKTQSNLLAYLKMKYPRAGNVFVSNDLTSKFKSFDFVENPNNDILAKFEIYFIQSSQTKIIKQVKLFFNSLMEQLDEKFPVFKSIMEDKVFRYEEGQGAEKKRKILNYKIGRKISENAPKFVIDDSEQLTINSPQIFRTFVKWVGDLQDWFKSTQDQINSRQYFKTYKITKTGNVHEIISKDQIDELHTILKKKLKEQIGPYNEKLKELRKQMDIFNINLLKILYTIQRKQKYVPLREAKIIKYAMLNTKIVSWMLGEMLIFLLKTLIEVGQELENTKIRYKLDLIKFTVTDLMRAQVVGNKKQILAVYQNIEQLQKNKQINIIKIKNRLGTSLNDAMIIFTIKNSKLICELQLILSQGGSEVEKLKNIQFLNHVLYQLQRSPYGVLSEIAVILGYKDNKINFENKIRFEKNQSADFDVCSKRHKIQTWKVQKKPFICNQCTEFYLPLQNIFEYSYCQTCYTFQCCKCAFAINQQLQKQQINSRFVAALQSSLFTVKLKPKIPKDITIQKIIKRFYPEPVFFKNIFPRKTYSQVKPKDLISFLKNKQYVQAVNNEELEKSDHIYFLLVQFRGADTKLKMYYWNQSQTQVQNCYDSKQNFFDLNKVCTSYYDFLVFARTGDIHKQEIAAANKFIRLCFEPEEYIQNIKAFRFLSLSKKHSIMLVLKVQVSKQTNNVDGLEVSEKALALKKDFVYDSLEDVRKKLPDIQSVRQNFLMKNIGITSSHLDYLKNSPEKSIIKSINICDNKIVNIDVILEQCNNLKELIISKNFIKEIKIKKKLPSLQKLIAYENLISLFEGLELISEIVGINLERNKLKNIKPAQLLKLKSFNVSNNKINSLKWIEDSMFPKLQKLFMSNSGISYFGSQSKLDFVLNFPELKELNFSQNMANKLKINSNQLIFLDCSNCSLRNLQISTKRIQNMNLSENQIDNLSEILRNRMTQVKRINLNNAGNISVLPELDDAELVFIDLSNCGLIDVSNLSRSSLLRIQTLILDGNENIKSLPSLKFTSLKKLSIKDVNLNNLDFAEQSVLPLIEELEITGEAVSDAKNSTLECPAFKLNKLKKLKLKSLSFLNMSAFSKSQLSMLQQIIFQDFNSMNFPIIHLQSLKNMSFKNCSIQNVEGLHKSIFKNLQVLNLENFNEAPEDNQAQQPFYKQERKLQRINSQNLTKIQIKSSPCVYLESLFKYKPALQYFNATDNKMKQFPIIELKNCKTLDFSGCQIQKIKNLFKCRFDNLEKLNLQNNLINSVPQMDFPNLKKLHLQNNKIEDVHHFQKSSLPKLQFVDFDYNSLNVFPSMNFPSLKEMQIGKNPIKTLEGLGRCNLKSLQKFILANCKELSDLTFPIIKFPNCKQMKIIDCNIANLDNLEFSELPQLHTITVINLPLKKLPKIELPVLKTIKIKMQQLSPKRDSKLNSNTQEGNSSNKSLILEDVSNLSHWRCPKINTIAINNTDTTKIPTLNMDSLQILDFEGCNITDISQFEKSDLPSLTEINLSSNKALQIMHFPTSVDQIIFTGCNFKSISSQSLQDACCKTIELGKNKIEEICEINTTELQFLNLQENLLSDIYNVFKESPLKLKNLNLKNNNIKSIPQFTFPELNYLNLSVNKIASLRIKKKNFPNLIGLYAYENQITYIAGLDIPTLNSINFCKNQLQDISFFVEEYKETEEIKISNLKMDGNKIKTVKFLPYVSNIYLKDNQLENLDWLSKCKTDFIAILSVDGNKITNVKGLQSQQNNLARFNVLSELNLSDNNLSQFEFKDATRFPCLDNLNLSKNNLSKFPNITQATFPNLVKLNMSNNKLAALPTFCKLNKLKKFDVSNNKIANLQSKELIFKELKQLLLEGNLIKDMKGIEAFKSHKLQILNVSLNLLRKLPKISTFVTLKQLRADKNQLEDLDDFLQSNMNDWANLKFIYLIKQSLPDKTKEQIRRKVKTRMAKSECRNTQLVAETKTKISRVSIPKDSGRSHQRQ